MIKYLGSKRRLLPRILDCVESLPDVRRVLDLFSGTSRVGRALKEQGYDVVANDHNAYAWTLARCYVEADRDRVLPEVEERLEALRAAPPRAGWFTKTFCEDARFFHPDNGARIEGMREQIAAWELSSDVEAVLLTSLMEAADRVDSTTGVQMAYLKAWAPRAMRPLELRLPALTRGPGRALQLDAAEAASTPVDLAYLDPPYNQHSYRSNYHVWETLVLWDEPTTYGVACKREDCRTKKSAFNSKRAIREALREVLERLACRHVVVSFSDEGHLAASEVEALLAAYGPVRTRQAEQPRYVGAKIGIYNPRGERVGRVGRLENREFLFVVDRG